MSIFSEITKVSRRVWNHGSNRDAKVRSLARATGFQLWKRTVAQPVVLRLENGFRFLAYPDCHVSSMAVYFKQPYFAERQFLSRQFLPPQSKGGTLIDIGCNVGIFSLSFADLFDRVLMFEPNAQAMGRTKENLVLNNLPCETFQLALSDQEGEVLFEDRGGVDTTNRVVSGAGSAGASAEVPVYRVPCRSLDQQLRTMESPPQEISLIKIDVEGHEEAVFRGMLETLSEVRPRWVMFEYLQRTRLDAIRQLLDPVDYDLFELDGQSGVKPAGQSPKPLQDLFAAPRESAP